MNKFKFTCTAIDGAINTYEFDSVSLSGAVEGFEQFLRGSGFHFEGNLYFDCDTEAPWINPQEDEIEESYTVTMPGTIGSATLTFPDVRCKVCGLTAEQLGTHPCYDLNCGLK